MTQYPHIVLIDHASGVNPHELAPVALALTRQVREHFALPPPFGHGLSASIRVGSTPHKHEWVLGLFKDPDQPGALGYHDTTPSGLPLMKAFPMLDLADGVPWSITASHEVLETLADPELALAAQAPDGRFWAYEICDAVENDVYMIDGISVSNFVLPPYFQPPPDLTGVRFDHLGLIVEPYEIRKGGYGQYWNGNRWSEIVTTQKRAGRAARDSHSRHARRQQNRTGYFKTTI